MLCNALLVPLDDVLIIEIVIKDISGYNAVVLQQPGLMLVLGISVQQPTILHTVRLLDPLYQQLHD